MKTPEYETFIRPNFEAIACGAWLIATLMVGTMLIFTTLPSEPFWGVFIFCVGYFFFRLPQAIKLFRFQQNLLGQSLTFIDLDTLASKIKDTPDQLWLGEGFEWTPLHAQRLYQLTKNAIISDTFKHDPEKLGSQWIHGVEPNEIPLYQPIEHTEGHTLIVGTTGSGKTRCFDLLITQAILRGEAVIIIDPKGDKELKNNAMRACLAMGQPERFVFFHPGFPEDSVRMNPLRNFNRGTEIASRIAALIPSETGADPFKAFGQMALNNIVQGLLLMAKRPDLRTLRRFLEGGAEGLVINAVNAWGERVYPNYLVEVTAALTKANTLIKQAIALAEFYAIRIQPIAPNSDLEGLLSMFKHDKTHYSKMIASLMPILNMLTSSELGNLLSPDTENLADARMITDSARIINQAKVAYIGLDSLTDSMVGSAIGSLLLADLTAVAGDRYNYGIENKPVNIFIDEAAEVINDPFIQLLNKGRGAKMRCIVATQTFADFAARTGSEVKASQVLGNINNWMVLRVMDSETQQYITDNLIKVRLNYVMRDQSMSSQSDNPGLFSGAYGERLMEEEGDIFPPQLLGQLPNLEYIAKISGGRLIKGCLPILHSSENLT